MDQIILSIKNVENITIKPTNLMEPEVKIVINGVSIFLAPEVAEELEIKLSSYLATIHKKTA